MNATSQDFGELIQTTGLWMISHPNRQQDHNDDTDGRTYKSEFTVTALTQTDRLRRRVILYLS